MIEITTRIILTRHGETAWNLEGRVQGKMDSPLTSKGILQARQLALRLISEGVKHLYSSDLPRALATANEISSILNLGEVKSTPALREFSFGEWEGQVWWELREKYPGIFSIWDKSPHLVEVPGAESFLEVTDRAWSYLEKIIQAHKGHTICVVTHGITLQLIVKKAMGIPIEDWENVPWQHNTALNIFEVDTEGVLKPIVVADHSHLLELNM